MKILILSCNTGEGHNAAGKAIREAAIRCGHTADMLDMFLLSGKKTSHAVGGAYVELVKHMPHAFGMLYKIGMAISSNKHKSPVYYANALMAKKLAACFFAIRAWQNFYRNCAKNFIAYIFRFLYNERA